MAIQVEQRLERLLLQAVRRLDTAHVIDDERHVDAAQQLLLRENIVGIEMQHDVPAQGLDAGDQAVEHGEVRHAAQMLHEIEAYAANAAGVQALEFLVGDRILDAGHAAIRAVTRGNGVQGDVHFRAVAAGMHDDRARNA
jgi:hypothetical protein